MRTNTQNPPIMVPSVCYGHLKPGQKPADVLIVPLQLPSPVCVLHLVKTAA